MSAESVTVTVVIPAKDEAPTIATIIEQCRPFATQILVVDGHSGDGTADLARQAGAEVILDGGRGKGQAMRTAIPAIAGTITVFIDADGSHVPADIPHLIGPIADGACDHVTASRLKGGSSELHGGFDEFLRLAGSSFITACINWRFGARLSDTQNGFRAVRTSVLRELNLRSNITTIEQEMIIRTLRLGYRMGEQPSHEHSRLFGTSRICVWKVAHRYAWSLFRHLFFA